MPFDLDVADTPRVITQDYAALHAAAREIVLRQSTAKLASMLPQFSPAMQEAVRFWARRRGKVLG